MGIAGLGTYSSTSFYYAMSNRTKNIDAGNNVVFGLKPETEGEKTDVATTSSKTGVATTGAAYSRCITACIRSEELLASQSADGEMLYSYKASEQSFKIWINSDGENKTYSIEGMDKDGQPFAKEINPYDVDPEDADFPEFAALCMYIRNTDETADMLANEYFATDDILEKGDYMDKLQGFSADGFFEKTEAMLDNIDKLMTTLHQIADMRNDINSFFEPFFTQYLVENVDLSDYPDIAGAISEDLSSEKVTEEAEPGEVVTPLGFGFANAGMMGYGMSAALVEKPGCDDTIIRVKISTGSGTEEMDVNLSEFDPKNATPVEMFAYCQYMDATGEGVNSKWGSWNALKGIAFTDNGADFGSLDNIMNKKMNWNGALAKSQTSYMDPKTNEIILSAADLIKMLEESHKLTARELKEEKDWRDMSDEEWDKMLEGIDKYIEAFKERIRRMKEMQEKAAQKAALEADSGNEAIAASSAALAAANGFEGGASTEAEDSEGAVPTDEGDHEKNWTKKLNTDDQTILMTAKEAQKMENMAMSKFQELQVTESTTVGISSANGITECASVDENENKDKIWTIAAFGADGISSKRCQNGIVLDSWEIKYNNAEDANRVNELISRFDKDADLKFAGSKEFWTDFLKNNMNADKVFAVHGDAFDKASSNAPYEVKEAWMDAAKATGYLEGGKMNHISELLIHQVINRENGVEDYQNVFGSSVASAMKAAKELLYGLENPLTPVSERGENAKEYIEQEKEFYRKFIENLEEISNNRL